METPAAFFNIRRSKRVDESAVYEVCLKTGDSGRDATGLYDDPLALGHIYVGPYLRLEPDLAFVLEDAAGVCGYVLGALDSARFYGKYLSRWLPELRRRYREPTGDPESWTPTEKIYQQFYKPEIYYPGSFHEHPSHMHIDLLPRAQGRGWGTRMVNMLLEELGKKNSYGVHLAMSAANTRAERFYRKLGFYELARVGPGAPQTVYLGKRLERIA